MKEDEAPAAINAYLIERVRKLEAEVSRLTTRTEKLAAFLEEYRQHYIESSEEAAGYFSLMDGELEP